MAQSQSEEMSRKSRANPPHGRSVPPHQSPPNGGGDKSYPMEISLGETLQCAIKTELIPIFMLIQTTKDNINQWVVLTSKANAKVSTPP